MWKLALLCLLFSNLLVYSQGYNIYSDTSKSLISYYYDNEDTLAVIDTSLLIKRAKMLTTIRYGANSSIDDIFNQSDSIFTLEDIPFILFIKINHQQKINRTYTYGKSTTFITFGCYYILAYSSFYDKYYRLVGFENDDFQNFYADLSNYMLKNSITRNNLFRLMNYESIINYKCYYEKYITKKTPNSICNCNCGEKFENIH